MLPYTLGGDRRLRRYASALDASADYRVLRRLPRLEEMWMTSMPHGPDIRIGVIDIETTGLADNAKIIEIALVKIALVDGQLGDMSAPLTMFEDPGEPLAEGIVRLTASAMWILRARPSTTTCWPTSLTMLMSYLPSMPVLTFRGFGVVSTGWIIRRYARCGISIGQGPDMTGGALSRLCSIKSVSGIPRIALRSIPQRWPC